MLRCLDTFRRGWLPAVIVLCGTSAIQAQGSPADAAPTSAVRDFYRSYLVIVEGSKDPLKSDRALMDRHVDQSLLAKLDHETEREEDYFTKSQDVLDDWAGHVAVASQRCSATVCRMAVTLGLSKPKPYRITVDAKATEGGWKITKVSR